MLNALVEGASESYAYNISNYVSELFRIQPELPSLYTRIIEMSQYLTYAENDTEIDGISNNGGYVIVKVGQKNDMPTVESRGAIFPILLQQTIKGILEISVLCGLPEDRNKTRYIMSKADFGMTEKWDSRLGYPLWEKISEAAEKSGNNPEEVGYNFILMELSNAKTPVFNETLQEVFANTSKGTKIIGAMCDYIKLQKEEDEFNDYIEQQNSKYPIEDGYFTAEELIKSGKQLNESVSDNVELSLEIDYNFHVIARRHEQPIEDIVLFSVECRDKHNGFSETIASYKCNTPEDFNRETYDVYVHTSNFSDDTNEIITKLGGGKPANFAYYDEPEQIFLRSKCNIKPFVMSHLKQAIAKFKKDTYYPKWQKERVFAVLKRCGVY